MFGMKKKKEEMPEPPQPTQVVEPVPNELPKLSTEQKKQEQQKNEVIAAFNEKYSGIIMAQDGYTDVNNALIANILLGVLTELRELNEQIKEMRENGE